MKEDEGHWKKKSGHNFFLKIFQKMKIRISVLHP